MLVKHIHQWNGELLATLVAVDKHKVGITVFNEKDYLNGSKANKISGMYKAKNRAEKDELAKIPNRTVVMSHSVRDDAGKFLGQEFVVNNLYDVLMGELDILEDRSVRYFSKHPVSGE